MRVPIQTSRLLSLVSKRCIYIGIPTRLGASKENYRQYGRRDPFEKDDAGGSRHRQAVGGGRAPCSALPPEPESIASTEASADGGALGVFALAAQRTHTS